MPGSALEVRRGPSWGDRPPGECRLGWREKQLIVQRADPRVWLDDEFLRRLVGPEGDRSQWAGLAYQLHDFCEPATCCQRWRGGHCYSGGILTIWAENATVVYQIGRYLRGGLWEARLMSLTELVPQVGVEG